MYIAQRTMYNVQAVDLKTRWSSLSLQIFVVECLCLRQSASFIPLNNFDFAIIYIGR